MDLRIVGRVIILGIFFGLLFSNSALAQKINITVSEFDHIRFKNGDLVSCNIKTKDFKLRAPYATLTFEKPEISHIAFEGGGRNIDVMVLKCGDKISGVIEVSIIKVLIRSGTEIDLDKEKIKKITFKK